MVDLATWFKPAHLNSLGFEFINLQVEIVISDALDCAFNGLAIKAM